MEYLILARLLLETSRSVRYTVPSPKELEYANLIVGSLIKNMLYLLFLNQMGKNMQHIWCLPQKGFDITFILNLLKEEKICNSYKSYAQIASLKKERIFHVYSAYPKKAKLCHLYGVYPKKAKIYYTRFMMAFNQHNLSLCGGLQPQYWGLWPLYRGEGTDKQTDRHRDKE